MTGDGQKRRRHSSQTASITICPPDARHSGGAAACGSLGPLVDTGGHFFSPASCCTGRCCATISTISSVTRPPNTQKGLCAARAARSSQFVPLVRCVPSRSSTSFSLPNGSAAMPFNNAHSCSGVISTIIRRFKPRGIKKKKTHEETKSITGVNVVVKHY